MLTQAAQLHEMEANIKHERKTVDQQLDLLRAGSDVMKRRLKLQMELLSLTPMLSQAGTEDVDDVAWARARGRASIVQKELDSSHNELKRVQAALQVLSPDNDVSFLGGGASEDILDKFVPKEVDGDSKQQALSSSEQIAARRTVVRVSSALGKRKTGDTTGTSTRSRMADTASVVRNAGRLSRRPGSAMGAGSSMARGSAKAWGEARPASASRARSTR